MSIRIYNDGNLITASISGDIDHHSAAALRIELDSALEQSTPSLLVLDFGGVGFMDSSGIGLILGRARILQGFGGRLAVKNASPHIMKLLKLAGIDGYVIG